MSSPKKNDKKSPLRESRRGKEMQGAVISDKRLSKVIRWRKGHSMAMDFAEIFLGSSLGTVSCSIPFSYFALTASSCTLSPT